MLEIQRSRLQNHVHPDYQNYSLQGCVIRDQKILAAGLKSNYRNKKNGYESNCAGNAYFLQEASAESLPVFYKLGNVLWYVAFGEIPLVKI